MFYGGISLLCAATLMNFEGPHVDVASFGRCGVTQRITREGKCCAFQFGLKPAQARNLVPVCCFNCRTARSFGSCWCFQKKKTQSLSGRKENRLWVVSWKTSEELESPFLGAATFRGSHFYFPATYFLSRLTDTLLEVTSVWSQRTPACWETAAQSKENGAQRAVLFFTVNFINSVMHTRRHTWWHSTPSPLKQADVCLIST